MDKETRDCLKVFCLEQGLPKKISKALKISFRNYDESEVKALKAIYGEDIFKVGKGLAHNDFKRYKRVLEKVDDLIKTRKAIFLTLTFTNDVLSKNSPDSLRRYVARYLKKECSYYVANVDYGEKKGRLHYHAIVEPVGDKVNPHAWKYGNLDFERIGITEGDSKRTSRYLAKLTNHAIKETAGKGVRMIYSRKTF